MVKDPNERFFEESLLADMVVGQFRRLREAVFRIVPEDCLHRYLKTLDKDTISLVSVELIDEGAVSARDVCSLCTRDVCPHHDVPYKLLRVVKLRLLNVLFSSLLRRALAKMQ